ncbi:MAG: hypothetical protein N3C13_05785, partial [Aquificaceae bacterium]|nr:hypothetical protein [Aquificaceae bacterium]
LRDYVYNITSGKNSIRKDTLSVQATISNIMGSLSQMSLLTVNGASSQQPNYICAKSPNALENFLLSVFRAAFGQSWRVVEREHREKDAWRVASMFGIPPVPDYTPLSFHGALVLKADDGTHRLVLYDLVGGYGVSGSWMDRSEFCQFSVKLLSSTSDSAESLKELLKIGNGVYAGEEVNPEWVLRVVQESQRENRELNRMIAKIQKENREYNSWMANSWANLLSDQTYVRDPSTGEVFRVYKESWRTGEFWREPVFGDVILGGVKEGSKLQELLKTEGWRRLDESLGGFK